MAEAEQRYRLAAATEIELSERRYYNDQPMDYLLFKAMALRAVGRTGEQNDLLVHMLKWSAPDVAGTRDGFLRSVRAGSRSL